MELERIKKVKLLTSLKGTDTGGKQILWLEGTVFDKEARPFPQIIRREYKFRPELFEILQLYPEVVDNPPPPPSSEEKPQVETPKEEPEVKIKLRKLKVK